MNPGKRVHASVIVLLALTAWFLPVPDGLQYTQANRARLIARELNLAPDSVRLTVRLLEAGIDQDKLEEGIVEDIEEDEDPDALIVRGIVADLEDADKPLSRGQVNAIRAKLAGDELGAAEQELRLLSVDAWFFSHISEGKH